MAWQKRARLVLAVGGIAVAAGVYMAIGERETPAAAPPPVRLDPKAVLESSGNIVRQVRGAKLDFVIQAERVLTYEGGTTKLMGVQINVRERAGRDFVISGREAQAGENQKDLHISGDVTLVASDGFELTTDAATFSENEGIVRAPAAVSFRKGRMTGSGVGMVYDKNSDLLSLTDQSRVKLTGEDDNTLMEFFAGSSTLSRPDDYLALERNVHVLRGEEVLDAERALARLTANEEYVTFIELRGKSEVQGGSRVLELMSARDIDLDYTEDGSALERVVLKGDGSITMKTEDGRSSRRIAGETLNLVLAPDGSLSQAVGEGGVQLDLPAPAGAPSRIIRAMTLDAAGAPGKGLTSARFVTNVEYREDGGSNSGRVARSDSLQVSLTNEVLSSALFNGRVRFEEQALQARAARAGYAPQAGMLRLEGSDAGGSPRVSDERINVDADTIDVTLDGHAMTATGNVKTTMRATPAASNRNASPVDSATRLPGLFRQEQPVNASAGSLDYKGASAAAVYSGEATLWQGDTAIRADTIVLDQEKGNLTATGAARSTLVLAEGASTGRAAEIRYDDAARQLSYTTAAPVLSQLTGPQGDLRAGRIELLLKEGGGGAERLEAYNNVTARIDMRVATGARLTYVAEDQRYVMTGAAVVPVKLVEECRETTGKTLIFFKSTDRIIVDGNEEIRTETSRSAPCSAPRVR